MTPTTYCVVILIGAAAAGLGGAALFWLTLRIEPGEDPRAFAARLEAVVRDL